MSKLVLMFQITGSDELKLVNDYDYDYDYDYDCWATWED